MGYKISHKGFAFAEATTDAPTVTPRIVGLQSKCNDQMKTPQSLRSLTEVHIRVAIPGLRSHHQRPRKNKNRSKLITRAIIINIYNNNNHRRCCQSFEQDWGSIPITWTTMKRHTVLSLSPQHQSDSCRLNTATPPLWQTLTAVFSGASHRHFSLHQPRNHVIFPCTRQMTWGRPTICNIWSLITPRSSQPTPRQQIRQ